MTRRLLLVAPLLMFAVTTSASAAECKWFLWSRNPSTGAYSVEFAYESKKECKRAAAAGDKQSTTSDADHRCLPVGVQPGASGLPDTMDPRGPKEK
jgi:hypothetical protein